MKMLCIAPMLVALIGVPASLSAASATKENLMRTQTSFDLTVPAPYAEAAPLFGPEGERAWAGAHWNPIFLHPQPAHDEEGAVFTVRFGQHDAVWINTAFDLAAHHFQYVYFMPGLLVTTIDVRFTPANAVTHVHVTYTRTAIAPDGNAAVEEFTAIDRKAGAEWQAALDNCLAQRAAHSTH